MRTRWMSHRSYRQLDGKTSTIPGKALTPVELALRFSQGNLGDLTQYNDYQTKFAVRPRADLSDYDRMDRLNKAMRDDADFQVKQELESSRSKAKNEAGEVNEPKQGE